MVAVGPREFHDELGSTQDRAVARAREGAPAGTRVVARTQTSGRGRATRRWSSPPGGLYLSEIVTPPAEARSLFALAIGATLAEGLTDRYGIPLRLKWPNDLLVPGPGGARKLAGILVDLVPSPTLGTAAVVGLGVNVANDPRDFPAEVRRRVAVLSDLLGTTVPVDEVEELAVGSIERSRNALDSPASRAALLETGRSLLYGVGRTALLDGKVAGRISTIGDDGELVLHDDRGPVAVRAGELRLPEDP